MEIWFWMGEKTLWEKEKILFTTQSRLLTTWERSLLKTLLEKEKMLEASISLFPTMFSHPSKTKFLFIINIYFVICKCFEFGPVYDFVVW